MTMMAFSDAVRLGAALRPQAFGRMFGWKTNVEASCAMGAALEAVGRQQASSMGEFVSLWPTLGLPTVCPECAVPHQWSGAIVIHLNDSHAWTRERIADWFAQEIERQPTVRVTLTLEECVGV